MSMETSENERREKLPPRQSLASFFISRPIFAIVLAIVTMLAGVLGIYELSITQYPDIAPTTVRVHASYSGASAEAVENSVTTVIESAMTGLEGLTYMSASSSTGSSTVTLTFDNTVEPDIAQVQVQNNLSRIESQLPDAVQDSGLRVFRSTESMLMIGNIVSADGTYSTDELSDIMTNNIEPIIERLDGVGGIQSFGSGYAMRIWLDPLSLEQYQLTPSDITSAITAQNTQVAVGYIGSSPVTDGQQLRATVTAQSLLQSTDDFKAIILKSNEDGSTVRLGDVTRVEMGLESYGSSTTYNGMHAAGFGVQLASGANAIDVAATVHDAFDELEPSLPEGVSIEYSYETTPFVELSIEKVEHTLIEAILLVFVVLFLFLQNFRATLIPMIAVPVVLMGTFAVLAALGYSINTLTMFAMVLAIGLLVDDAIVVVENVERIMTTEKLSAKEATEKSMGEITGALIGVALVLTAVFIPMAFFSGSVGVIYRQFSVTIVSAMVLSVLVAIILTPALCATMLKPVDEHRGARKWLSWFNTGVKATTNGYVATVGYLVKRSFRFLIIYAALGAGAFWIYEQLPTSFFPEEDQGVVMVMINLPDGANAARTQAVIDMVEGYFLDQEKDTVESAFMTLGFGFGGSSENNAMAFVRLKDFDERTTDYQSASALVSRASAYFSQIRDAEIFVMSPPAIQGLGQTNGFSMYMLDNANNGHDALNAASDQLAAMANQSDLISYVRGNAGETESQLKITIDQEKAGALGIDLSSANAILSTVFGSASVNDFIYDGDLRPVIVQGEAYARMQPDDVAKWYAQNSDGEMVPFSVFSTVEWTEGESSLARFGGESAISISGSSADGVSSGDAMDEMERLVTSLNGGYTVSWTGLSYQERLSGSQANLLYGISALVVFLALAALYESWSIPFSVLLAVPVGIFGAVIANHTMSLDNDVYFKVGLLTTMGLASKNAILIVEFARELMAQGLSLYEATLEAARIRIRPIVMTSLAFMLGVLPLAVASGAGSASQNAVGIVVLGGMVSSTTLGIFFVPIFFAVIVGMMRGRKKDKPAEA